jgi:hypothetical protein
MCFFGIEEIALSLEEPFSILPLDELVEDFLEKAKEYHSIRWRYSSFYHCVLFDLPLLPSTNINIISFCWSISQRSVWELMVDDGLDEESSSETFGTNTTLKNSLAPCPLKVSSPDTPQSFLTLSRVSISVSVLEHRL